MFIFGYLRASTQEQDALRAKARLKDFAQQHNHRIAGWYVENASGAALHRPELMRLLQDAEPVKWSTKTGHRVRVFPVSVF
ncbi:TPA: recombinase family protein [Escherichia coli]|nr:recombinase family protein [Enterobacter hormaechei]ELT9480808.1 recombinase family protein [Escherichia coli]MBC5091566.1 recombinase family protein [Klebsiella quasipneumoniae]RNV94941.1 hypothetical protein CAF99_022570 [Enterobacter hormaechei subsp. steigerwaltii]WBN65898.1 recombinase family protein [Enterobacter cloacae]HAT3758029.1 recombinase family protein [Citrobacter amalonaticus]HEB8933849.1 recombinase family protein [Klebsiella pneumoniae]